MMCPNSANKQGSGVVFSLSSAFVRELERQEVIVKTINCTAVVRGTQNCLQEKLYGFRSM